MKNITIFLSVLFLLLNVLADDRASMQIKILYADNLPALKPDGRKWDAIGYADPMVTIHVGGRVLASTSFQKDNPNRSITWNETFSMTIDPEKDQIGFKIFDKDVGINDLMGEYFMSMDDLPIRAGYQTFKFFNGITLTVEIQSIR